MKFTILGSGGCVSLPKPLCFCPVCTQARERGQPYARFGCSLYLHDARALVDTPEDIAHALNYSRIRQVDTVLYSHWDPDHTMGMRIFEHLRLDWREYALGRHNSTPIEVLALPGVMEDLNGIRSPHGPFLDYYEHMKLARRRAVNSPVELRGVKTTLLPVDERGKVAVFVFEKAGAKLVYAPCDCKPFPDHPLLRNADVLVIGNTIVGPTIKGGLTAEVDSPIFTSLYRLDEVIALRDRYDIGRVIVTHLEEDWGKSYDDYIDIEKRTERLSFACDSMEIVL